MGCEAQASKLSVEAVSWGPKRQHLIIRDITFSVGAGEMLAIIGPNGAGKSSLLRCLFNGQKPTSGHVMLDESEVSTLSARMRAQKIAVVLQDTPAEFPLRVIDLILLGRLPHRQGLTSWSDLDRQAALHALDHVELRSFAYRMVQSLSGGERQRVLVARALAQQPSLIILDEPTNHLDIRQQLECLSLLKGLGITVITTLHDIALAARFADRIIVLSQGRIVADGVPQAALSATTLRSVFGVDIDDRQTASPDAMPSFAFKLPNNLQTGVTL